MACLTGSIAVNPIEYSRPRSVMWPRNSLDAPPVSVRTSTRPLVFGELDQGVIEHGDVVGAVEAEAGPGRSSPARVSPVPASPWSTMANIGWCP